MLGYRYLLLDHVAKLFIYYKCVSVDAVDSFLSHWHTSLLRERNMLTKFYWPRRACWSVYDTKCFINLLGRAFKGMKNGIYIIVIALLVTELFKITCDVTILMWTQSDVRLQNMEYLCKY